MPRISHPLSLRSIFPIVVIAIVALGLSLLSYQASIITSQQIAKAATTDLQDNARIQAHDISASLENRLFDVKNNLEILANAPLIVNGQYLEGRPLINVAEKTTQGFTDSYFWLDENGMLRWAGAFADKEVYDLYYGADRSDRPYFIEPRNTHKAFFTTLRDSVDSVPRIYMGYPIMSGETFKGVVVASLNLKSLASSLTDQLLPSTGAAISLMDRDATVLFTQNDALLGKNYFSDEVQTLLFSRYLPAEQKDQFNTMMHQSIEGKSGTIEFSSSGVPLILAYNPVMFDQGGGNRQQAMSLHLTLPKAFASDVALLIEQQRNLSAILPVIIGAVAIGIAFVVVRWNSRLEHVVKERTSKLEAANQKLELHDKAQREFINIAAHELRTPIQPLLGVAEMLEGQFEREGKEEITVSKAEIDMITRNAKRLHSLSSDILEVSRIETNTMRLNLESFDLKEKILNVISDMRNVIPERNAVQLVFETPLKSLTISGDRERVYQVIANLLTNAIKFTENGQIVVSLERKDDDALVQVTDSGSGIASDIYPKLFTKFATNSDKGTGLGLYIAKSIVEAHGGKIWAENNSVGKGATFRFTLPIVPRNASAVESQLPKLE